MKRKFFLIVVVLVLLYGRTTSEETFGEKGKYKLRKNTVCCFEQILEATHYKSATVRPLNSHLINHPSKIIKTRWALLEKQGRTH